jgi:GH15 family glucan-1,4-alpha-glucosidase
MKNLDLALIGNCTIGALVDTNATITWACFPRFDADPMFCALLKSQDDFGFFSVDLAECARSEQTYLENTAILVTRLFDEHGGAIEITDFAPRFKLHGRTFHPMMLVRRIRRLAGSPRILLRMRPACDNGAGRPTVTWGSNHIRYIAPSLTLRLTTDASLTAILQESSFLLDDSVTLMLGADETVNESASEVGRRFLEETTQYWRNWVRNLAIPFEWQTEVIRATITLKLNAYDDTGAIIAAMTTSIPEAAGSIRNWDYRFCWLRDSYFVVNVLNRLGATRTMERYIAYIINIAAGTAGGALQPVYGIDGRSAAARK